MPNVFFVEQIGRLNALVGIRNDDGMMELARVLETSAAGNRRMAEAIVDSFIEDGGLCPGPREISMKAWSITHPDAKERPLGNANCPACHGSGWHSYQVPRKQWVYTPDGHEERLVPSDYAKRCNCAPKPQAPVPQQKRLA